MCAFVFLINFENLIVKCSWAQRSKLDIRTQSCCIRDYWCWICHWFLKSSCFFNILKIIVHFKNAFGLPSLKIGCRLLTIICFKFFNTWNFIKKIKFLPILQIYLYVIFRRLWNLLLIENRNILKIINLEIFKSFNWL